MHSILTLVGGAVVALFSSTVWSAVTTYTNKQEWQSAVGSHLTIDFMGFPNNTLITDQYASLGVFFTDGADFIHYNDGFLNDGVGVRGAVLDTITIEFEAPIQWLAIDFPGSMWIELYYEGEIFYVSAELGAGGPGHFAGLVSSQVFDKVRFFDMAGGGTYLDDLHFGPPIPAPGALVTIALAGVAPLRRRRRRG